MVFHLLHFLLLLLAYEGESVEEAGQGHESEKKKGQDQVKVDRRINIVGIVYNISYSFY